MELKRILHHLAGSMREQESPLFAETLISHHLLYLVFFFRNLAGHFPKLSSWPSSSYHTLKLETPKKDQIEPNMPQPVDEAKYVFVWSEVAAEEPKSYQSFSCIHIRNAADQPEDDGTWLCAADFKWGQFEAEFTCYYHPTTDTFSDFEIVEGTRKGGMENVEKVIVCFHRELDGERVEVVDGNGNLFLFVQMELGWEGNTPLSGDAWGKKALRGERNVKIAKSSEKERENLELDM